MRAAPRSAWRSRRLPRALPRAAAGRAAVCAPPAQRGPSVPAVLAYMQLLEDYSEPQPSVFYQTPQKEHVYQQKNKLLMEVYGFNDSLSAGDAPHELAPPPALPPKQRQLVGGAHEWPGPLGPLSCSHLSLQDWLLLQSRPLQLALACTQNVCFLCRHFSLSLFCGCNIDFPERRESIRAQGRVCAGPSVVSIYIVGLTAQPLAPPSQGRPSEDQLCGSRVADTEPLCVLGRHTLPPLKPLLHRTPRRQHRGAVRLWAGWRDAGTSGGHSGTPLNPLLSATSLLTTEAAVRL